MRVTKDVSGPAALLVGAVLGLTGGLAVGCQPQPCRSSCDGCCDEHDECQVGTTRYACGPVGSVCSRCTDGMRCIERACQPWLVTDGGTSSGGCTCAGCCLADGTCLPGNLPSACGTSRRWCVECASGERCVNGACSSTPCAGCVDALGQCRTGTEVAQCGQGGGVCLACLVDQTCVRGLCVAVACGPASCSYGCCRDGGVCSSAGTAAECGVGGLACVSCGTLRCIAGLCQP